MSCKFSFKCVVIFLKIVVSLLLSRTVEIQFNRITKGLLAIIINGGHVNRGDQVKFHDWSMLSDIVTCRSITVVLLT